MPTVVNKQDAQTPENPGSEPENSKTIPTDDTAAKKQRKKDKKARKAANAAADTEATEATETDPYYCPGCGKRWKFLTECRGATLAAPHPPILVISTDELSGNPANHTPAPDTDRPLGV